MFWQEQWFLLAVALGPFILDIFSGGELFGKGDGTVDEDEATQTEADDTTSTDTSIETETSETATETDTSDSVETTTTSEDTSNTETATEISETDSTTSESESTSSSETTDEEAASTASFTTALDEEGNLRSIDLDASAYGNEGADTINGGEFDDLLIGGSQSTPEDDASDTLVGGDGNDIIYLGNGDVATGGADADQFRTPSDASTDAVITDFTVGEDALVVEHYDTETVNIQTQSLTDKGLEVTFSNGTHVILEGLDAALEESSVAYVAIEQ